MYEYINIRKTCLLGQFDLAEKMLRHVNSDGFIQTVIEIQMAVQQKNVSLFEELVEISGLDLSVFDNWFVAVAAVAGDSECAKVIFECPSVDPSVDNQKHFIDACEKGHAGVVKEFLKHPKINPALNYFQALNVAYAHGNHEVLRILKRDRRCFVWSEPDEDDLCTNCDEDPCICNDFDEDDPGFPGPPDCLQQ